MYAPVSLAEAIATSLKDSLNAAVGLALEFEQRDEGRYADFNGDLRGTDAATGRKAYVLVQEGESDNKHLLRLLHNAADKEAQVVLWIVGGVNRMHPATMEWLANNLKEPLMVRFVLFKQESRTFVMLDSKNWRKAVKGLNG